MIQCNYIYMYLDIIVCFQHRLWYLLDNTPMINCRFFLLDYKPVSYVFL